MNFCLPKQLADNLIEGAKKGEINIAQMYEMTSAQRRDLFKKYVDTETAIKINAGFEQAMVSSQKKALSNWAESVFKKGTPQKKAIEDRIQRLDDLGVLSGKQIDNFLEDLVSTRLGIYVTAQEASTLAEKANNLQKLFEKTSEFGTPTLEYFEAKKDIDNYMESLTPSSKIKVATSIIGRGSMLFSIKSPLLNIESNTVQGVLTALERRIVSKRLSGLNSKEARSYAKFAFDIHKKTGYDITRMKTLDDGRKVRGEEITTAQGKGKTRKVGRFYEDIVFNKLMSSPDVFFSAIHFADSANLTSTHLAKTEGLSGVALKSRALAIMKDAMRIAPQTAEGEIVRNQAIADAEYATWTNASKYSEVALGIRKLLNVATGDVRLGDLMMPFVKTPANVVGAGIDFSGVLLPADTVMRTVKVVKAIRNGETITEATRQNIDGLARKWTRAGLGITFSLALSALFDPEDFIGEYPTSQKEQELLRLQNATTNSVKIGDKWVSLDYFGALGSPFVAMMYAKKYGNGTAGGSVYNYYVGAGRQLTKIPGLEIGADVFTTLSRVSFGDTSGVKDDLKKGAIDFMRSRTIPAFVYDIAKATDKYDRVKDPKKPFDSVIYSIPFLRTRLPIRQNVLGQKMENEKFALTMLFGSRVKTTKDDPVINEITRLGQTGNLPSITNYARTSSRFKALKEQIGDEKFYEAETFLGQTIYDDTQKLMKTGRYNRLSDEEKAKEITDLKEKALEKTLKKFKYKKPRK